MAIVPGTLNRWVYTFATGTEDVWAENQERANEILLERSVLSITNVNCETIGHTPGICTHRTKGVLLSYTNQPASSSGFYVSTTGNSTNTGAIGSPWDIATALTGASGRVQPGDSIWLRAGTYTGFFQATNLNGTSNARVVVQNYPGERAIIDHAIEVELSCSYVDFRSGTTGWLEIANSAPVGTDHTGFFNLGSNVRLINACVHDSGQSGIFASAQGTGGEFYGNISYNNGFAANLDHGIYIQNTNGTKFITDNIFFNNYAFGIHCYTSVANAEIGINIQGNTSFMNGSISTVLRPNLLLGGGTDVQNAVASSNNIYSGTDTTSGNFWLGYELAGANHDIDCEDNWIVGGFPAIRYWRWLTNPSIFKNNRVHSLSGQVMDAYGPLSTATWSTNTYYQTASSALWVFNGAAQSLASWRTASGQGATDTATGAAPTGAWIRVRPNLYERGRANVTIYNWDAVASVSVDLSSVLTVGDSYKILNVENLFGAPAATGVYVGVPVSFPMSAVAAPVPRGAGRSTPAATGPTFQAFVVRLQGA